MKDKKTTTDVPGHLKEHGCTAINIQQIKDNVLLGLRLLG